MYHVGRNGQQTGPFSVDQLKLMAGRGELDPTDLVWKDGMAGWEPASTIPGVFSDAAPAPVTPLSSPVVTPPVTPSTPLVQATVLPPSGATMPPNYLVFAILTTLCCCLPMGIPAIIFASQVNSKMAVGDLAGATESSRKAKMWCWIALGCGILTSIAVTVLYLFMGAALIGGQL